ncbi:hypothetical protein [Pectobacterium aquaticum]|uniref:hypothetical protein n=1 Tax=Pectobacterium aquaticum TaxID=2204145 RepID=UPI000E2310E8|nr:hypothetical protein [Pectobacterium aquaticum]UEM38125.1 hypothetical protein DMB82_0013115 [Pectobacterium aquaticum]
MGLHVHNLGNLPNTVDGRDYFIYVLDYGWKEPLTDTLIANFTNMARKASESRSMVISGIEPVHFANEVFSWHSINGEDGESVLPAVMISTLTPSYFREHNNESRKADEIDDQLMLIPLKAVCETTDDVIRLINSIFNDIKLKKELTGFDVVKTLKKGNGNRFADALILEPNFSGIGVNLKKLFNWGG